MDADCPSLPAPYIGNEPCVNIGAPDCTVNPAIGKGGFFSFVQNGASSNTIRAVILGLTSSAAIADGSILYSCRAHIATSVCGTYPLAVSNPQVSDPTGVCVVATASQPGPILVNCTCCGDSNADGRISTAEATNAVLALVNRDVSKNLAADCNVDGAVSTAEATTVIQELIGRTCSP